MESVTDRAGRSVFRLRALGALFALIVFPACALEQDFIEVRHVASVTPASVVGAAGISVAVVVRDERITNRDRVSVKKNGYGMEMASIVATNDVVAEVRRAVEATLQGMGFQTGVPRDGVTQVEVHRIWNDFKVGFWSGQAVSEVSATLTVRGNDGRVAFTRMYTGETTVPGVMLASGENARLSLEQALDRLGQRIATDTELARALLSLGPSGASSRSQPRDRSFAPRPPRPTPQPTS
jgi:uncharacterized lipoprotein